MNYRDLDTKDLIRKAFCRGNDMSRELAERLDDAMAIIERMELERPGEPPDFENVPTFLRKQAQ